jgi:predicted AAA+ superfamily ATPase
MNEKFERLIERAEQLIGRIESVLPQPLGAPDWGASTAFRYRKRSSGHGALEPVRHVAPMSFGRPAGDRRPEGQDPAQHAQFVRACPPTTCC